VAARRAFTDETLPVRSALVLATAFFGFVAWDQSHWWRVKEDYAFGWLVPLLAGFVIYDRRARMVAAVRACAEPGSRRARGAAKWLLRLAVVGSLLGGGSLFLLGAFYRAGAGTSQPGTLAITLGAIALVLPLIFLNAPESAPSAGVAADARAGHERSVGFGDARLRLTLLFLFPVAVWLVSAPIVSAVESQLNLFLLRRVVTVVSWVFDVLGLPIEQQGNVLVLPRGSVGVEDACSGIRSLTGCLFAGSFLAAVFLDRGWKKVALVAVALVLAFVSNLARGLFLTGWAYRQGPAAIDGAVHDAAGYAVLGLTVAGLLCLLPLFKDRETSEARSAPPALSEAKGRW
jgi:exosortase/archaeosortase family protein